MGLAKVGPSSPTAPPRSALRYEIFALPMAWPSHYPPVYLIDFPAGLRQYIASAIDNKIALQAEPTGWRMEYRVKAVNKGGESPPTNTISVVL